MVPLALPLAILLSSIMTFGNLGEHYELVALKSSGISLQRIMAPLIFMTLLISILAFYFSNNLLPYANLKMGSLLYDVQEQKPALNIKEGIFYDGIDDYVIKVGKKDKDGITVHDVMIYDHTERMGNTSITIAEGGTMQMTADKQYLIFTLSNGTNYSENIDNKKPTNNHPFRRTKFKDEFRRFDLSAFTMQRTNEEFFKDNYRMMDLRQLNTTRDSLRDHLDTLKLRCATSLSNNLYYFHAFYKKDTIIKDTLKPIKNELLDNFTKTEKITIVEKALNMARGMKDFVYFNNEDFTQREKFIARNEIEWHRKFTLSIACLVLFFIGAPLGAIIRKGGLGLPVVISVVFFVIYHVISFTCEKMVREDVMPAYIGMWVASLVFLPIGVFLTRKATSDSSLFDVDAYLSIFRKLFHRGHNAIPG
jgi:lipopolysaccharide export system permease protein